MTIIIAAVFALFLIAGARAGVRTNQTEEASSEVLDRCPRCGNYLPCNCNHYEDTSYQHHHHHDWWASDTMNQSSEDDSCFANGHHHHGGSDDWI